MAEPTGPTDTVQTEKCSVGLSDLANDADEYNWCEVSHFPKAASQLPIGISYVGWYHDRTETDDWGWCLDFTNNTTREMSAVRFRVVFADAFNEVVWDATSARTGDFAPGILIQGGRSVDDVYSGKQVARNCWTGSWNVPTLASIAVIVQNARYTDGTVWNNTRGKAALLINVTNTYY